MLLRNSISSTRKFFKKTLGRFKSLFSGGHYQKLPKSPLSIVTTRDATISSSQQLSFKDTENLYAETNTTPNKVIIINDHIVDDCQLSSSISENNKIKKNTRKHIDKEYSRARVVSDNNNNNNILVEQKLKELMSNVDHALDIEEVLHYYSRLTCPAYLEIVDKFFAEILSEFFNSDPPR